MNKRLVLLAPGYRERGGAQRRSRLIAEELVARDWRVRVLSRTGSLKRLRVERSRGLTVIEVPGFSRRRLGAALYLTVALPLGLLWGLRAKAFVSIQLMSTSTVGGLCSLLLRRPFLAMATTTGKLSEVAYLKSTPLWRLRRPLLARASFLLAQTPASIDALTELVPRERIQVLPGLVNLPTTPPSLTGEPKALFAGRLSAEKNIETLLEAWRQAVRAVPGAHLTIAGVGGDHRSVEADVRRRVSDDATLRRTVKLPGWLEEMQKALATHDVFVLPSKEEGMSNALLEACASGRVVIASDIPANRAVLGDDYPLLFKPDDVNLLASLLERALTEQDLRRDARVAVLGRASRFSVESVIGELESFIDAANRARHQHA